MELEPELTTRLVHDLAKPVKSMVMRLEMMRTMPGAIKDDDASLLAWQESFEGVKQVLEDVQFLSDCAENTRETWERIDWNTLFSEHVKRLDRKSGKSINTGEIPSLPVSFGEKRLIAHALENMQWFLVRFAESIENVSISKDEDQTVIKLNYTFRTKEALSKNFVDVMPFASVSMESLTLRHNTGLVLYSIKRVLEGHKGQMTVTCIDTQTNITLLFPMHNNGGMNAKSL